MEQRNRKVATVSVLVPTYNRASLLPETLDSILSQTYSPEEIIVVDDGSTDNTREIVEGFHAKVRYRRIEKSGVPTARNVAASMSRCPYIAFCDSDDLWRADKLEKQMELHLRFPEIEHSFTNFSIVTDGVWSKESKLDNATPTFFTNCKKVLEFGMVCEAPLYEEILRFQPIFPSTTLVSKEFFDRIGGCKDPTGKIYSEDLEFALRCVQHAPVGIITEPVVGIRKHASNVSGNLYATKCGEVEILSYALLNHNAPESAQTVLRDQIALRRVDASYWAFKQGDFKACTELLGPVPNRYLTPKVRLKLWISRAPVPVASMLRRLVAP
ncbi:glycosyltransferase family 2 protein [Edaphobacter bradus]|uniref:glycosyltransferase family 2 protein n=1 Tax=Edaphobacter bradus TaxID=2259016 RepID=UPI0021E0C4BA|nr:glycosyltransferase family 2 protein [Edaphobacter bradus]